ncbi:MAG TPA: hypothetical protein VK737_07505 [Opitutales bacterium]|nr:hypothetical protein [Opitutales bacterium]
MPTKTTKAKPAAAKPVAAKSAPAPAKKPTAAPIKKPAVKKPTGKKTTIIARIDVGWGNSVYLRGIGGGLSWDVGVLMDNLKKDEWTWACPAGDGPITFKFVRNDAHWALGPDHIAVPGETSITTPQFPPW